MALQVSGIYRITNTVNGKIYVGLSVNIHQRWREHRKMLARGTHSNPHLQSSWQMYGRDAFVIDILQVEPDRERRSLLEKHFIALMRSNDPALGYNLSTGGDGDYLRSADTRARMSAAAKGKVRSPETRARISAAKQGQGKGRIKSPREIENLKKAHAKRAEDPNGYAFHRSEEWLKSMSERRKGVPWTPARREAQTVKSRKGSPL